MQMMMASPESCPALVLNADFRPLSYFPLSLWPWQETVKALGLADALVPGRKLHLAGISQGSAVAQLMAVKRPHGVASATLITSYSSDPSTPPPDPSTMQSLLLPFGPDRESMIARELLLYRITGSRTRPPGEEWLRQTVS